MTDLGFIVFCCLLGILAAVVIAAFRLLPASRPKAESEESTPPPPSALSLEATVIDEFRSSARVPATGREVFFLQAPHPNPVYEISFTGVIRGYKNSLADAFYETDRQGNFADGMYLHV